MRSFRMFGCFLGCWLLCSVAAGGLAAVDVTITDSNPAPVNLANSAPRILDITVLSGPGEGLIETDLTLSGGGSLGSFSGSDGLYFVTWTPPPAAEGTAIITVPANTIDGGNNPGSLSIPYDLIPPGTPTFTDLESGDTIGGTTTISGLVPSVPSVATRVEVSLDGGVAEPATFTGGEWSRSITAPAGALAITVTAYDALENSSSATINVTVDTTAPVLTVTSPAGAISQNSASLTVTGTIDDPEATITIADGAIITPVTNAPSWTVDLTGLAEGLRTLQIRAEDALGNASTVIREVTVDTTPPSVTLGTPSTLLARDGVEPTILVTFADAGTGLDTAGVNAPDVTIATTGTATAVVVVDDNDDADIATWRIRLTTLEGDGTVRVSLAAGLALDEVGNTSLVSAQSAAITVDNTAPTVASVTNNGTSTNQSVPVTIVLSEPLTAPPIIAVTNATPGPVTLVNALTYAVTVTATNPGPFGITSITATDLAGNVASVATGWTVGTYQTGFDVVIERGPDQELTTSASPIVFQITFDEAIDVATFTAGDLVLGGTAGGTLGLVLAADPVLSDTLFTATVTGMTTDGTVTLNLGRDLVQAAPPSGEFNTPADASAAVVTWDNPGIPVTIARGPGQNASTSVSPIVFTVTFTAPINAATFTAGDLVVGGTAGGTKLVVVAPDPGLPTTVFTATVTGMTTNGTVTLALPANLVESAVVGVFNAAADATAAEVDWVAPAGPAPPPPSPALSGGGCGVGAGAGLLVLSLGLLGLGRRRRG